MKILFNMFLYIFVFKIYWLDYRILVINYIFLVFMKFFDKLFDMYLLVFYKYIEIRSICCFYFGMFCLLVFWDYLVY